MDTLIQSNFEYIINLSYDLDKFKKDLNLKDQNTISLIHIHEVITHIIKDNKHKDFDFLLSKSNEIKSKSLQIEKVKSFFNDLLSEFYLRNSDKININNANSDKKTVLMQAITNKNIDFTCFLIKNKAEINKKASFNWTSLHQSVVLSDCEDIVKVLLNNNSDLYSLTENSQTCLHLVSSKNRIENLKVILDFVYNLLQSNHKNQENEDNSLCFKLKNELFNKKDHLQMTPFLKSASSFSNECCFELINFRKTVLDEWKFEVFDLNSKDFQGNTAFHYGFEDGNEDLIRVLLKNKAVSIMNNEGKYCYELSNDEELKKRFIQMMKGEDLLVNGCSL